MSCSRLGPCLAGSRILTCCLDVHPSGVNAGLSSSSVLVCHGGSDSAATPSDGAEAPTLKLADWGLHQLTAGGTLAPSSGGNPRYMSPEIVVAGPGQPAAAGIAGTQHTQSTNTNDGRLADIWAVGILLVELILGSLPAPLCGSGSTADTLQGVLSIARARAQARASVLGRMGSRITAESDDPSKPSKKIWPDEASAQYRTTEEPLRQLVDQCLEPHCANRLDARSLLCTHGQFARHLSTSNPNNSETDRGHLGTQSVPTVPPPPPVPLQIAAMQTTAKIMPASEAAALTRVAIRRLCERFFEWVAQHAGDTDAVDALIEHVINVKHQGKSEARNVILRPRRTAPTIGLPMRLGSFPMITLRDRSYSVAVSVSMGVNGDDIEQLDHGRSENFDRNDSTVFLLPFSEDERRRDAEHLTSDNAYHRPSTGAETGGSTNPQAGSTLDLCTSASTEPQKLSVTPSSHPLWNECSPQERQQLRVAVIADADLPVPLRERHWAYQEARVATFRALLEKTPGARNEIVREAKVDIPPVRSCA